MKTCVRSVATPILLLVPLVLMSGVAGAVPRGHVSSLVINQDGKVVESINRPDQGALIMADLELRPAS